MGPEQRAGLGHGVRVGRPAGYQRTRSWVAALASRTSITTGWMASRARFRPFTHDQRPANSAANANQAGGQHQADVLHVAPARDGRQVGGPQLGGVGAGPEQESHQHQGEGGAGRSAPPPPDVGGHGHEHGGGGEHGQADAGPSPGGGHNQGAGCDPGLLEHRPKRTFFNIYGTGGAPFGRFAKC